MAKGEYAVVGGTTRKIKKEYVVVGGQTRKIKKKYAVVDGKTRLVWSGSEFKLVTSPYKKTNDSGSYPKLFSDDGAEWGTSASNTVYQLTDIINVDGVLYGLNENRTSQDGALVRKYTWYLYKSTDGGSTWTSVTSQEGAGGKYLLRYLNGKLFVIGAHHSSGSSYKNYWHSSDLGATWTAGKYSVSDGDRTALSTTYSIPLDLRYGMVTGLSTARYYFLISDSSSSNKTTRIYQSSSHNFSFTYYATIPLGTDYCDSGAMSIRNKVLCVVAGSYGGSTYCYKCSNSSSTRVKSFSKQVLWTVASNSEYIVATFGTSSFKYNGTTLTQTGTISDGYFNGVSTFASTFVNGTRVFAFKAGGTLGSSTSDNIMYSDNYGETWTNLKVSGLNGLCEAMCSITDSYY